MTHRTREVTDDQCQRFADDLAALDMELARIIGRHKPLSESVWLGGDQKADNTEIGPERTTKAMALVEQARNLLRQADHEVAMYRAVGSSEGVTGQGSGIPSRSNS